ncbi:hypothetical protein AB0F96_06380 [Streptomyces sp. NPDC023998]|uniref:hypothetical protein n=1 Tax=Streptomyces sp. NPDC023998 TaxID=3154597 RepID=UPI00340B466B
MTQSGQGDEQQLPAARPAHEGVVLPADGSEPWIPGVSDAQVAPAGGQPWGQPWGPPTGAAPGGPEGLGGPVSQQGWPEPPQPPYGAQPQQGHGMPAQGAPGQALPPQGPSAPQGLPQGSYPQGLPDQSPSYSQGPDGRMPPQDGITQGLPGHGLPPQDFGSQDFGPQGAHTQALPPQALPEHGQTAQGGYPQALGPHGAPAQALPQGSHPQDAYGQGLPAQGQPQGQPGQALPQMQAAGPGDSDATQFIPPVAPGALPLEAPAGATQFLGTGPGAAPGAAADADATQYIAPVPAAPSAAPFGIRPGAPGDRQPPAEFDSLFRTDGPTAQTPASTQQLPRFETPRLTRPQYQQPQYQQAQHQQAQQHEPEHEPEQRKSSRVPVIAAVVVGCAVLGLGVSMVMYGGDEKQDDPGAGKNVAATSAAPNNSTEAAADPAKAQAEALDKLLADSNNSRGAVIRSVESIKQCQNLDQAAADLSGAANQRRGLVTRLEGLAVDKLAGHAELTSALTKAWQASASADDHYAAWAQQVKDKKGCKGGKARNTGQTAQANRASGEATKAKREASALWNAIARKYELSERRADQL